MPCLSKKLCLLFFLLTNFIEQVFEGGPLLDAMLTWSVVPIIDRSKKNLDLQSDLVFFAVSYSKEEITFQWSSIFTEEADKNKRDEKGREEVFDEGEIIVSDQPSSDAVHLVQVCTCTIDKDIVFRHISTFLEDSAAIVYGLRGI